MREQLIAIFDLLKKVETKGDSTVFMADCLRELANVINAIPTDIPIESEAENE